MDTREQHRSDPPTLWFVAPTSQGRLLKIVFIKSLCRNATTGTSQFADETTTTPPGGVPTGTGQYTSCPTGFSRLDPFEERFFGDSWMPRVSIGAGVNWNSPFGPFRIDFAYALRKEEGDDTKRFSFNVGTQF